MQLSVAIINYNSREQLLRCLESLPPRVNGDPLRVLVVDNASSDGSASMVATRYRNRVELVANKANLGFGRAVNQALERTEGRYLLVLNADIEVEPGALETLLAYMEQTPEAGLAGGRLLSAEGELQHSCRRFYTPGAILMRRTPLGKLFPRHRAVREHLMLDYDHARPRAVDWVQGGCLMIRREAVEQVGSMDPRYFLYFEDVDLARRMAGAGWGVHYVPEAQFVHHYRRGSHGGLFNAEAWQHLSSGLRYLSKWHPRTGRALSFLRSAGLLLSLLAGDLLLINLGFLICLELRNRLGGQVLPAAAQLSTYYPLLAGANIMLLMAFGTSGLYRLERSLDWLGTLAQSVKAVTGVALAGSVLLFFAPSYRYGFVYSRLLLILFYFWLIMAVWISRALIKQLARACWRRHLLLRRILVVGEEDAVRMLAESIQAEPSTGYEVAAVLPLPENGDEDLDSRTAAAFKELLQRERPGGVIFVAHRHSFRTYVPLVLESLEPSLEVRVATSLDIFPYFATRSSEICGQPAADVTRTPFYNVKRVIKRLTDILLAGLGLVLVTPVVLGLGLLIKAQDRGPIFFLQDRLGRRGRRFRIIKLRTMRVNAQVDLKANIAEGPLTLIPNDPRVIPLGRWLRRHKLDELPQLFNVLVGQMSLVGPRPPMEDEVLEYTEWQKGRLFVPPGLTGLWQIDKERKWRFNEMVELDLQYILNWSLLLDYSVLLRTVQVVLKGN